MLHYRIVHVPWHVSRLMELQETNQSRQIICKIIISGHFICYQWNCLVKNTYCRIQYSSIRRQYATNLYEYRLNNIQSNIPWKNKALRGWLPFHQSTYPIWRSLSPTHLWRTSTGRPSKFIQNNPLLIYQLLLHCIQNYSLFYHMVLLEDTRNDVPSHWPWIFNPILILETRGLFNCGSYGCTHI